MTETNAHTHLYIIAAMSENRVIGIGNRLPWHLPDEWENFRQITDGKPFLMGRKSFEAPDALHSTYRNIILTSKGGDKSGHTEYVSDLSRALALLRHEKEVFILGGASVFEQALALVEKLYLTIVHAHIDGDAFFPVVNPNDWELISSKYHKSDDDHVYAFSMNVYQRKRNNSS